jgi:CYTH domain-containing protein
VEFSSEEQAKAYQPPAWFGEDVTLSGKYQNSRLSQRI